MLRGRPVVRPGFLGVVLLVLVAAACDRSDGRSAKTPYDVKDVRAAFKEATGDDLVVRHELTVIPEWGDVTPLTSPEDSTSKYGEFGITVFENPERLTRAIKSEGVKPDKQSIYWRYTPANEEQPVPSWSAAKRYQNVRLVWITTRKKTDNRWQTLDRAMSRLRHVD
jgi:hypothetical protein